MASGKKDACYHKVKRRYTKDGGTWPSAYGSGALVKCRRVGAANWGEGGKKGKKRQKKAGGGPVTIRGQGVVMSNRLR
jgi:hypothetical protein